MSINPRLSRRSQKQVSQATRLIAPIKGIDARTVLSQNNPEYCIYSFNMIPAEYGMRVRQGFREWCINLESANAKGVGTIMPFGGTTEDQTDDRLFVVTNEGIWDCTTYNTPLFVLDFTDPGNGGDITDEAGLGVYTEYTTNAGEQILFYADSRNGLFQYSEITQLWVRATGINGPDLTNVVYVTSHKRQLWVFERDESVAWYLPIAAVSGDAVEFYFGSKFKHGGNLASLCSWTVDGGDGLDDYFVAISRAGDVLPYRGNDPGSADDWHSTGQYFIGAVPKGNRFAADHSGRLKILSSFGVIDMNDLIVGVDGKDVNALTTTLKISAILREQMKELRNIKGWTIKFIPSQGNIIIVSPKRTNNTFQQYVMNTTTQGWGFWREVPISNMDEFSGNVFFGTEDNRVFVMDVSLDDVLITPVDPTANGNPIEFSLLTTYNDLGQPALYKRGKYVRPQFVATVQPSVTCKFLYDYNLNEITNTNPTLFADPLPIWDADNWDSAVWVSGFPQGQDVLLGGWGLGRYISIATKGRSTSDTTLVGWDIVWDAGGPT